jgi:amino acid adenylation domain-containing protein
MNNILPLLTRLKTKNVTISLDDSGENLRLMGDLKSLSAEDKADLKWAKDEFITFFKEQIQGGMTIQPAQKQINYPISDAQRRIWVLSQFKDGSVAYNMPQTIILNEDIHIGFFEKAIHATIDRHEVLRTVFRENENKEIRQWILSQNKLGFKIQYHDFREEEQGTKKAEDLIKNDSYIAFDLENGPLLRAVLLQLEDSKYVFYFNMHHIICDGWSMKIISKDVFTYYERLKSGNREALPPLKIQYKDYAVWQLDQLQNDRFNTYRKFWMNKLGGKLERLSLVGANERPDLKTHKGRTVATYFGKELSQQFKNFGLRREGTLFMSIISVLSALLQRETKLNDIILGSPSAGRSLRELEEQIGFYVNTLVYRTHVTENQSLVEIFQNVKQTILDANTNQMYPFDRLVDELNQERQTSRSAVFDMLVVLQNTGDKINDLLRDESMINEIVEIREGTCIYDIKFDFQEEGEYLKLLVEYNTDIYHADVIENFIKHLKTFAAEIFNTPEQAINSINYALQKTQKTNLTIVDKFERQVDQNPENIAFSDPSGAISYKELNERINRVARFLLQETNVRKGEKVAGMLSSGKHKVITELGTIKAGAVFLTIQPDISEQEMLRIIDELRIQTLIIEKQWIELANRLIWMSDTLQNYCCLDSNDVRSEKELHENEMMSQHLWDHVGKRSEDDITAGGWISSYTGEPLSREEMEEYSMNAYHKLKDSLSKDMRVLEIGCSSGITLGKIAPEVKFYLGTDLSPVILEGTSDMIKAKGLSNVTLKQLVSHEISELNEGKFDLIIINSVIQNFHGHNYLLQIIRKGIKLLEPNGRIFIGDVMDLNKKTSMLHELERFKKENRGNGYTTKLDFSSDLFVSGDFFKDLVHSEKEISTVVVSEKIGTLQNELTRFRYDVILTVNDTSDKQIVPEGLLKKRFDNNSIALQLADNIGESISPSDTALVSYISLEDGKLNYLKVTHEKIVSSFKMDHPTFNYGAPQFWATSFNDGEHLLEMYGTLLFGGKLVAIPNDIFEDKQKMIDLLQDEEITTISLKEDHFLQNMAKWHGTLVFKETLKKPSVFEEMSSHIIINESELVTEEFPKPTRKLSEEERQLVLHTFNQTDVDYPKEKTILDFWDTQLEKTPNAVAVVFGESSLTYRQLDEQSNQMAHYIIEKSLVQSEDLIGIKLERSEWMIVAVLAVLKTGAAYVPIDPNYPADRIEFIEQDAKVKLCLNETVIESFKLIQGDYPKLKPLVSLQPNDLAYVIYTSGSTGKPKGVLIEHQNAAALLNWSKNEFSDEQFDILLFTTSLCFDLSVFEIFFPLSVGKQIWILSDGLAIKSVLNTDKKLMVNTVPSVVGNLLQQEVDFSAISVLNMAGEPIPYDYKVALKGKGCEVRNLYGPSEDTTYSTCWKVENDDRNIIGKPIDNTQLYILDEALQPVPIGAVGEIYLGGYGVARGYLNRPELTNERFVQNPFKDQGKLYRTGDLAKWLTDGSVEFVGRIDNQVKIRGYRIELGEIEQALTNHEEIKNAAVSVIENEHREKEIVAYILSDKQQHSNDLMLFLEGVLPDYMLPSFYIQLEQFPLTPNGKLDRKALPSPNGMNIGSGIEYVVPTTELEKQLVDIWKEVLKHEHIGIKDNFFALGGHSIKAVRLGNAYQKAFGVNLSLDALFENKTIESHVQLLNKASNESFVRIERVMEAVDYPISDAQRRLWVLSQFEESSMAYNIPGRVFLNQTINIDLFKKAIHATMNRHEILRTVFVENDRGEIRQVVKRIDELGFEIDIKDYRAVENTNAEVEKYMAADSSMPFDLENGTLIRAALLQVEEQGYVFYFNMHHIISDGWSMGVISRDALAYYESFKSGKDVDLPNLRIQYKDYSNWQLEQLNTQAFKSHRRYWMEIFSGNLPVLTLPSSRKRPRLKTYNGAGFQTYLDKDTTQRLKQYTKENGGSLFMGILASWNVLMYHYTAEEDIIIGTPVAGREHADLEDQIGFYVNTLALRNKLNPTESFDAFYQALTANTVKSFSHQMYPFDRLVEDLDLHRDTSRSALFDVILVVQNNADSTFNPNLSEIELEAIQKVDVGTSKFDVNATFEEVGENLLLKLTYNPDVYESAMIENLIRHYKQLLPALLNNSDIAINGIDYLTEEETAFLLNNTKSVTYPIHETIVSQFEKQVDTTPNHIAVLYEGTLLTYTELDQQANQLAAYLTDNYQIHAKDLIGIIQPRGIEMIVCMLAVLKAGGAYVPIDSDNPADRVEFIIEDSGCKVCLDASEWEKFTTVRSGYSVERQNKTVSPEDLAYIIYTSGSTGKPKGVMVDHHNVVRLFKTDNPLFDFESSDVWTLYHSYAFDFSVWEMYGALLFGGKLIIVSKTVAQDSNLFLDLLSNENVTVLNQTPSAFYNLSKAAEESSVPLSLRYVIFGGEALSPDRLTKWQSRYPACKLVNMYGITEATVHTTYKLLGEKEMNTDLSNIGIPIPTVNCLILDQHQRIVPQGVSGELYIGGEGVAIGYLNREELTNERFVSHPYKKTEKLYRTGDRVRLLEGGDMEYLGRIDNQVKIRGHRIELGEVEHILEKHPLLEQVVVLARSNQNDEKELVAYIVSKEAQNTVDLRAYLEGFLPKYMLPAYFVQVAEFPLTNNGKIDRRALPAPEEMGLLGGAEYLAPRDETEEGLIRILANLLSRSENQIGIRDNFFDLGVNSISLMRLYGLINNEFDSNLRAVTMFEHPTVESLAKYLKNSSSFVYEEQGIEEDELSSLDDMIDLMDNME